MKRTSKKLLIPLIAAALALLLISGVLSGCSGDTAQENSSESGFKDTELVIQGSDTLLEVSQNWAEAFMNTNPGINISITGGGSGTGIAALINKTADLANASRGIKDKEIEAAEGQGLDIQEFTVAWDGISVVVNKNNPVTELSIEQISKIFTGEITNWSEVNGNNADIVVTSRDSSSGTFGYFKERVVQINKTMEENDYTQMALFLASNAAIRNEVAGNENAIGYIGLGYLDDSVKAVRVIGEEAAEGVAPSIENVQDGSYPISRPLYVYAPDSDLTDLEQAFLDFAMGEEGQAIALEIGFVPLS
ncbi:MAG: phosphate ABC transporter substrate-binding protein [Actinomycetia bacterium]|nr:phosphate ABC transporter substrate-binding protein [Actinomycetes bacterium]